MNFRTYGNLALVPGGAHWLMTKIEPHVAIRMKQLFPRIEKARTDDFLFQNDQPHCADLRWFIDRYPLRMTAEDLGTLTAGREAFQATQAELERILMPDYEAPPLVGLKPGQIIRPYQAQAIEVLARRKALLLGDDLGLGKTYSSAAFMLKPGALPAAVVVQTHLQKQWEQKLTEFTNLRVHKIKGTKPYSLPEADVYIFKYSQLLGWVSIFATGFFKAVTYDEVQELRRGVESQKGAAAFVLSESAEFKLGLSATPIYNYGAEIWHIMRCIDPAVLGDLWDFSREWLLDDRQVKDPEALGTYLREQHVFIRRSKRDVGQFVPPINRIIEIVETDENELKAIEDLAHKLALKVTSGSFVERGQAARELDLLARQATGVGKARSVAAYVRILLEAGVPVILLGWHREVYSIWLKELAEFNPVMYTGSESPTQKEAAKTAFVEGRTKLFIMSLRSGAGVDGLQFICSTVIFGELDWSGKVHDQIIGRVDREGQPDPVTAIYLNSEDGSDPPMIELLGIKASQAAGIVDPGKTFEAVHSDDSRIKLLAQQFLSKKERDALNKSAPIETPQTPIEQSQAALELF